MMTLLSKPKRMTEKQKRAIIAPLEAEWSGTVVRVLDGKRLLKIQPKFPDPALSTEFAYGLPPTYFDVQDIHMGPKNQVLVALHRAYYTFSIPLEHLLDPRLFERVELPKVEVGDTFEATTVYNQGRRFVVTGVNRSHVDMVAVHPKPQQRNEIGITVLGLVNSTEYRPVNRVAAVTCRVKQFKTRDLRYKLRVKLAKTTPSGQEIVWIPDGLDYRSMQMITEMMRFSRNGPFGMHPMLMRMIAQ